MSYRIKLCDVLVIGGGGAGALAALEAAAAGLKVIVAAKGPMGQSGLTPTGNGGTADGPPEQLFEEMVTAGRYLNDQNLVSFMAGHATESIEKLITLGVTVTRYRPVRVCVPGPGTVKALRKILAARENVEILEDVLVTGLLKNEGRISGACGIEMARGEFLAFRASAVVLATGGLTGELYPRTSNNPFGVSTDASGTGHIMAFRAGAELIDPEMIQFVPLPAESRDMNIRFFPDFWAGPYQNRLGQTVEENVDRYPGSSYSWQLVAALYREIQEGRGPIYIDQRQSIKPIPKGMVRSWDSKRRLIQSLGLDPRERKVELTLGSHFCMGGVKVNEKTETTVPGLYAAGEIMGGVHGALRIGGFSFTQMIVFGLEAGKQAAAWARAAGLPAGPSEEELASEERRNFRFVSGGKGVSLRVLKTSLQKSMGGRLFVERDAEGITRGLSDIRAIRESVPDIRVPEFRRFNLAWMRAIEFSMLTEAAELVAEGALMRQETRAFHRRKDFPMEDNRSWLRHTLFRLEAGSIVAGTAPVDLSMRTPA